MLDVSRPSLREALRRLEAEKLLVTVIHRGPVVATITEKEARELCDPNTPRRLCALRVGDAC
jgi:DNA-binding GntR family transcriptional regulator